MSASGRFCCKSRFALVTENSAGRGRGFRVKMRGTSSPRDKLTGDFGNAIEVIRICDYFPFGLFAKNLWPCNFRVLQQNRPIPDSSWVASIRGCPAFNKPKTPIGPKLGTAPTLLT